MAQRAKRPSIAMRFGASAVPEGIIGSGGQGTVYRVSADGRPMALKWYRKSALGDRAEDIYNIILDNVERQSPAPSFLWPRDISEWKDGSFGYLMDLAPAEHFHSVASIVNGYHSFASWTTEIDALLAIVLSFELLHNRGLSYQDINSGNFLIDTETGDVLICDCDNIVVDGHASGIKGTEGFMAPEVILRGTNPGIDSDRFSLGVFLFYLLLRNHPFEGIRYFQDDSLSGNIGRLVYVDDPCFIMTAKGSKAYDPVNQAGTKKVWDSLPDHVKDLFIAALGPASIKRPSVRPIERDWMEALADLRSTVMHCGDCDSDFFAGRSGAYECPWCGKDGQLPWKMKLADRELPAIPRAELLRCQLEICNSSQALDRMGHIVNAKDRPYLYALVNDSEYTWVRSHKGEVVEVPPGARCVLADGAEIRIGDEMIQIQAG